VLTDAIHTLSPLMVALSETRRIMHARGDVFGALAAAEREARAVGDAYEAQAHKLAAAEARAAESERKYGAAAVEWMEAVRRAEAAEARAAQAAALLVAVERYSREAGLTEKNGAPARAHRPHEHRLFMAIIDARAAAPERPA
jgi:hypothetical protein